jgi:hypothetical protein
LGAGVTAILSVAAIALGVQQGEVQKRLANLELREKMTCFGANRFHLDAQTDHSAWAFNIVGDAQSSLPLYASADAKVRAEFVGELRKALEAVERKVDMPGTADALPDLRDRAQGLLQDIKDAADSDLDSLVPYLGWADQQTEDASQPAGEIPPGEAALAASP